MNTSMVRAQGSEIAQSDGTGYGREQVELIKRTIAKGATDDELQLFIGTSKRLRLDPFARQIFAIKRWDPEAGQMGMTTHISIDGLRLIADRTQEYLPSPELPVFTYNKSLQLISVMVYVLKWRRDAWHRVPAVAFFDEYAGKKKDGNLTKNWAEKPHIMLAKCAEALAIRKAFPNETSGVYIPEEFDEDVEETRKSPPPVQAPPFAAKAQPAKPPKQRTAPCGTCARPAAEHSGELIDARCSLPSVTRPSAPVEDAVTEPPPVDRPVEQGFADLADTLAVRLDKEMMLATTQPELDAVASRITDGVKAGEITDEERKWLMPRYRASMARVAGASPSRATSK